MPPRRARQLPIAPFLEHPRVRYLALHTFHRQGNAVHSFDEQEVTVTLLAELVGMQRRSFERYRASGEVPEKRADEWCCRLGLWMGDVWPDEYAALVAC